MPFKEKSRNYPKHEDFNFNLLLKRSENSTMYNQLYDVLYKVYSCYDVDKSEYEHISFASGLPVDHIIKTIKWLLFEQDIRYWNYSGRKMTWQIVPDKI